MTPREIRQILQTRWPARCLAVLLVLVMPLCAMTAFGQTFTASITGVAMDQTGAAVPGAKVVLTNTETKDTRVKTTGDHGTYDFSGLNPGTYQIAVTANGFKDYLKTGLILRANTAATVDAKLDIGSAQDRVVVSADTVLVDTETPNNSVTMDQVLIANLPNSTRNPLNFVLDLAGTTEAQGGMTSRSQTFDQNASAFGINGGRSAESEILIDGAPSTAIDWGGLMVAPIQDSVQEQQVVQNEYDAVYSRGGEGVVTLITKNGSSNFHGELYDYFRNDALDANTFSNKNVNQEECQCTPTPRDKFHRNQFGANASGPIWRAHNLFFFAGYEGLRQPGALGRTLYTVPTAAERSGDFSQTYNSNGSLMVIYNPFTTTQVTDSSGNTYYTRLPYAGNKITSGIDPVGQAMVNLFPLPNLPGVGPNQINNFVADPSNNTSNDKFDWRIDWAQSDKHRMFVRMSDRVRENQQPGCAFCTGADDIASNNDHGMQIALNDTVTPNANWVIDTYGAYSHWWEGQTSVGYGVADLSKIGLPTAYSQAPLLPLSYVSDSAREYSSLGSSYSSYQRYVRYLSTGMLNITRELHSHTLKFGFNYDVSLLNIRQDAPVNFNFSNFQTGCDAAPGSGPCDVNPNTSNSGNAIASMLLGVGSGGSSTFNMDPAMSEHSFGLYLQDNWRITHKLTIYAGLRYENQRPATERHNRIGYFDPNAINSISTAYGSPVRGVFEYVGIDGRSRSAWEPDNLNFSPRLGLAYQFAPKWVARLGSGIFYTPSSAMIGYDDGGQSPNYTAYTPWLATQNNQGYIPENLVSNPFPGGLVQPNGNSIGDQALVGLGAGQVWIKGPHPTGVLYQWSADAQYQVSPHSVFEMGYTGVRGRRLLYGNPNLDLDQLPTADLAMGNSLNDQVANPFYGVITDPNSFLSGPTVTRNLLLRPFPAFGYLQMTRSTPGARSQFDALNLKYTHSFSAGLSSITTYQWSKNLDDGSEARLGWTGVATWRDATNTKLDYAYSSHDVPQSFAEALVYQLPYGAGRHWGGDAPQFVRQTIGGWNVSTAIRLASGLPLPQPVSFSYNPLSNYGFPGAGLPDVVGNPHPANRNSSHWIDPAAFQGVDSTGTAPLRCDQTDSSGNGCQPFQFRYGNEPARMNELREGAQNQVDLGVGKVFTTERFHTEFRADFLNLFNHPIVNNFDTSLADVGYGFGQAYGTRNDPRNIQLSLKISY
ncbi:MAG TPA: TonB-dependent receptor [Acidobacteriaceae bacterium]